MISANKQLIENAYAVQERIAQVLKEGEFVAGGYICSADLWLYQTVHIDDAAIRVYV